MNNSSVIFNKHMNITENVNPFTVFHCTSCSWVGVAADLSLLKGFSCCPKCQEFDVRVQNTMVNF